MYEICRNRNQSDRGSPIACSGISNYSPRMTLLTTITILFAVVPPLVAQQSLNGECMGTTWSVVIGAGSAPDAQNLIQSELDSVDQAMSTWKDDSEVSRFNAFESTDWFSVSKETATVVQSALQVSDATNGAFDITVSPLIDLWNFDRNEGRDQIPADTQVAAARKNVGYKNLEARLDPPALRKSLPALSINLSAIAKGYAVDRVIVALQNAGVQAALVEVGGEVRAIGLSPKARAWTVGIEQPLASGRSIRTAVPLEDRAMATSGDYRNFYVVDGKSYSHTIDPRTGKPVQHDMASASVLAPSCMLADAWATALMVTGPGSPNTLPNDFAALLITRDKNSNLAETRIGSFPSDPRSANAKETKSNSMWPVFIAAAVVFLLAVVGMAAGVIASNKRLKGSCGGLAGLTDQTGQTSCELCAAPSAECQGENAETSPAATPTAQCDGSA